MAEILVIKLGALGDVILATGAMQAIRRHHAHDRLTLLTTQPFAAMLERSGWFDRVIVDERPKLWTPLKLWHLVRTFADGHFSRVYDLQTSSRSSWYFSLWPRPKPEWSGIARGCSLPDANPERDSDALHNVERLKIQLAQAGIADVPPLNIDFLDGDVAELVPDGPFVLLVPGSAPHRLVKRWPAERYGALAAELLSCGFTPMLVGGKAEADAIEAVRTACPAAIDLSGRTSLGQVAALGRRAAFAVGNDTGPMHLIAAAGCPVLTLFSSAGAPSRSAPGWPDGLWLQRDSLADLTVEDVLAALPEPRIA